LKNPTIFPANTIALLDKTGRENLIVILKATFSLLPTVEVSPDQVPLYQVDEHYGDPTTSSVKYPSDFIPCKPGTDILMLGHAYSHFAVVNSPDDPVPVELRVGEYHKTVHVFGDRVWEKKMLGYRVGQPEAFEKMPLVYEHAFGGKDRLKKDETVTEVENRNPVGIGFHIKNGGKTVEGSPLPNLEDPDNPITSPKDHPQPAGFAPVDATWQPRINYTGTYDDTWRKTRAPFLPKDFQDEFYHCASPGLICQGYLQGGEEVVITNASPEQETIAFRLPKIEFNATFMIHEQTYRKVPVIDTLLIEPDENRFTMVWRASQPCNGKIGQVLLTMLDVTQSNLTSEIMA
jgi:hypothetical protein